MNIYFTVAANLPGTESIPTDARRQKVRARPSAQRSRPRAWRSCPNFPSASVCWKTFGVREVCGDRKKDVAIFRRFRSPALDGRAPLNQESRLVHALCTSTNILVYFPPNPLRFDDLSGSINANHAVNSSIYLVGCEGRCNKCIIHFWYFLIHVERIISTSLFRSTHSNRCVKSK